MSERILRIGLPVLVLAAVILAWDLIVRLFAIPPFVLPGPGLVLSTLIADGGLLWQSLLVTLAITFAAASLGVPPARGWVRVPHCFGRRSSPTFLLTNCSV